MKFESNTKNFGYYVGFIFGYFLFTTMLYLIPFFVYYVNTFISTLLNKSIELTYPSWSYLNVVPMTLSVTIIGLILKRYLT